MRKGGIALFDSGIGGLTVLDECLKILPGEVFYYYGDNKNAPYGTRSDEQIKKWVDRAFRVFEKLKVKAVVLACNTVTAVCIEELRKKYAFPIIGAEPALTLAAKCGGETLVLATNATCRSFRFLNLCENVKKQYPNSRLTVQPCLRLAEAVERRCLDPNFDFKSLLPSGKPDGVVLGCTHYIYIKKEIEDFYGCKAFDGNVGIAKRLKNQLKKGEKIGGFSYFQKKWQKNRDERPPAEKTDANVELKNTNNPRKTKGHNTNKCSWLCKPPKGRKMGKIFFLGSGKRRNKYVFKHMFGT